MISESSCAKMDAMPSAAAWPRWGPVAWYSQVWGQRLTLPTNPKLQQERTRGAQHMHAQRLFDVFFLALAGLEHCYSAR